MPLHAVEDIIEQTNDDRFTYEVSDEALEVAGAVWEKEGLGKQISTSSHVGCGGC